MCLCVTGPAMEAPFLVPSLCPRGLAMLARLSLLPLDFRSRQAYVSTIGSELLQVTGLPVAGNGLAGQRTTAKIAQAPRRTADSDRSHQKYIRLGKSPRQISRVAGLPSCHGR